MADESTVPAQNSGTQGGKFHTWSKKAKKYRLKYGEHNGINEAGDAREIYTAGDEVMLEPESFEAFKDKFESTDVPKADQPKGAADEAADNIEKEQAESNKSPAPTKTTDVDKANLGNGSGNTKTVS